MIIYKVCTYERVEVSRHVDVDNCFLQLSPSNTGGPGGPRRTNWTAWYTKHAGLHWHVGDPGGPAHLDRLFGTLPASRSSPVSDEYEQYVQTFTLADEKYKFAPLIWWKENEKKYPNLSRMPSDLLSIPSMSAETERSFSSAGKMVSPLRTRLDRRTIGMAQSMRSWSREGIVLPSWQ